jgi:hypothetical protein
MLSALPAGPAQAQTQEGELAAIETDNSNCAPTAPSTCHVYLVNRSTTSRVVVNVKRRVISNFSPTVYDRHFHQISQGDSQFEVLLSAGDRVPLVPAIALFSPLDSDPAHYVRYQYTMLGAVVPGPDDIPDAASPNVDDYFRLVVTRTPGFDNSDVCRVGAVANPATFLTVVNFHPTKTIVITHRNTAPRYGSNPEYHTDYISPGSTGGVGCVTDIAPGYIDIQDVRFM